MSLINISAPIESTDLSLITTGNLPGTWDNISSGLGKYLNNINDSLNKIKDHDTVVSESLLAVGEIWFNKVLAGPTSNKFRVRINDINNVAQFRYLVMSGSDNIAYSFLKLSVANQAALININDSCILHWHEGSNAHTFRVSNPEEDGMPNIPKSIFTVGASPDAINGALDKVIPYMLLYHALGHGSLGTEETGTNPNININGIPALDKISIPVEKDWRVTAGVTADAIYPPKKQVIGYLNWLNARKASLNGDPEKEFSVLAPNAGDATIDYHDVMNQNNMAVPYKYAEERYFRPIATAEKLGVVKIGAGLSITADGILSITQALGINPPVIRSVTSSYLGQALVDFKSSGFHGGSSSDPQSFNFYWGSSQAVGPSNIIGGDQRLNIISPVSVEGLDEGKEYYFIIGAYSKSFPAPVVSNIVKLAVGLSAPGTFNLGVQGKSQTSVSLSWEPSLRAVSYQLIYSKDKTSLSGGAGAKVWEVSGLSAEVKDLESGQTYYFLVIAIGADGQRRDSTPAEERTLNAKPDTINATLTATSKSTLAVTLIDTRVNSTVYKYAINTEKIMPSKGNFSVLTGNVVTLIGKAAGTTYYGWVYCTANLLDSDILDIGPATTWSAKSIDITSSMTLIRGAGQLDIPPTGQDLLLTITTWGGGGGGGGGSGGWGDNFYSSFVESAAGGGGSTGGYEQTTFQLTSSIDTLSVVIGDGGLRGLGCSQAPIKQVGSSFPLGSNYINLYYGTDGGTGGETVVLNGSTKIASGKGGNGGKSSVLFPETNVGQFTVAAGGVKPDASGVDGASASASPPFTGTKNEANAIGLGGVFTGDKASGVHYGDGGNGGLGPAGQADPPGLGFPGLVGNKGAVRISW